jgi:hypothetical protein
MNPEKDGVPCVENANFGLLCCGFSFVRLSLSKISDQFGRLPERIIQCPIHPWTTVYAER